MNKFTLLTIILALFYSCKAQNDKIENQLLKCYNEKNIVDEILDIEKELVSKKILNNESGESYIQLLEKIRDEKYGLLEVPENLIKITKVQNISGCQKNIYNTTGYANSKVCKLNEHLKKISRNNNINANVVVNGILKILKAKDFEIPYYKLTAFKVLLVFNNGFGIREKLPKPNFTKSKTKIDYKNSIIIVIDKNKEIVVNNKALNQTEFQIKVKEYLQNNKNKSVFIIKYSRNTPYRLYIDTINFLNQVIMKLRNEYALKEYNLNYNDLKINNKSKVDKIYPKKIIEKEIQE